MRKSKCVKCQLSLLQLEAVPSEDVPMAILRRSLAAAKTPKEERMILWKIKHLQKVGTLRSAIMELTLTLIYILLHFNQCIVYGLNENSVVVT